MTAAYSKWFDWFPAIQISTESSALIFLNKVTQIYSVILQPQLLFQKHATKCLLISLGPQACNYVVIASNVDTHHIWQLMSMVVIIKCS